MKFGTVTFTDTSNLIGS